MTYGQPGGGRSGRPYGPPPGQPDGRPGYGQGAQQPPQSPPPQYYAPPQHHAPPGHGRRPRGGQPEQPYPYAAVTVQDRRRRVRAPAGGPVVDEDERWAVPAYVGMFVSGFVAPAIVLVAKGRTSPFARFHAVQALNLFVAVFACTFTALLLAYFKGVAWIPLVLLALAAGSYVVTRAAIGANRCEWYRLPAIVAWPIFR
ncbi:hypothetical protein GCM10027176_57480 [Actinoallomurus bryophytorum]|uniref:Putative membrane protein n=1 Tax=Actinoallomurus bryophytorum TaxID=1490222 RepID=A0A543CD85_9ACTN|nr:DUF4870 domain-containing protein [Actinoallomurus bryophytorum]TQL94970.1 putative membrane protein [Actinoallomurus bryophytorum]